MSSTLKVTKKRTTTATVGKTNVPVAAVEAPAAAVVVEAPPAVAVTAVVDETLAPKKIVTKKKTATATTTDEPPKAAKATKKTAVVATPEPIIVTEEVIDDGNVIRTEIKKKRIATRETVLNSFDSICQSIIDEITNSKEDKNVNGKSLKFLRNINKNLGTLKKDAGKLIRQKKKTVDGAASDEKDLNNTNKLTSGFLKPVPISNAMAQFTGWAPSELKSRVEVTKFLCSYIKDNNLQNPEDRRQILADAKLAKLLDYKNGTPLTYFDMQSHLKKHFPKAVQV
jgi:chromatin remodeling complex protein RSC6